MTSRTLPLKICLGIGATIGIVGVLFCTYVAIRRIGDGVCGASVLLFVFGLPTTLLEILFERTGLVKGTWPGFIALSCLYLVNWMLVGTFLGIVTSKIFEKN